MVILFMHSSLDPMVLEKQIEMLLGDMIELSLIGARAREKCSSYISVTN